MIAMTDVARINRLNAERGQVAMGVRFLDAGWRVSAVGITAPAQEGAPDPSPFTVPLDVAPGELTDDVKALLAARLKEIDGELARLGVEPEPEPEPEEPEPPPKPEPREQPAPRHAQPVRRKR